jgi:CRISPR/Cas system-associated exonuclease Cas4 (RecB family)
VTDHKTGKVRLDKGGILGGGRALQPVLYALAAEKLFPDHEVTEGRLSYCTAAGGFEIRGVPLAEPARKSAEKLAQAVAGALSEGFLPAYPATRACRFCDYRVVCGPYEELRTRRKPETPAPLLALKELRELP